MIVQTAPDGEAHFVIMQTDHALASGQFAQHFGNSEFEPLAPPELMLHVIIHHDDGWTDIDAVPRLNPATRLPYHLGQTPRPFALETSRRSPEMNEAFHPYTGILSSMHSYGFYNGRYNMLENHAIDHLEGEMKDAAQAMLDVQIERQQRLVAQLSNDPALAPYVEQDRLFQNYNLLQFFDMLALYIQTTHPDMLGHNRFTRVRKNDHVQVTIEAEVVGQQRVQLTPWPFDLPEIQVSTMGRWMKPLEDDETVEGFAERVLSIPLEVQTYVFVRG